VCIHSKGGQFEHNLWTDNINFVNFCFWLAVSHAQCAECIYNLQGSAATLFRWCGKFKSIFVYRNFIATTVKESLKSIHVWQSYARNNKKDGCRQLNVRELGSLRPWDHRGKCYMDRKRIQCLSNASQHVPIYLRPFLRYSGISVASDWFSTVFVSEWAFFNHILLSPGYAPGTIAVSVTWIEREFNAC